MRTHSPNETRELAKRLAKELRRGDVLLLWGDLGAGKSEFTRGLAQGLGVTATVTSPSFTILNVYDDGRIPLYHFDWYRLNSVEELYEMGMEEFLGGDGVAVVEWPSQCPEATASSSSPSAPPISSKEASARQRSIGNSSHIASGAGASASTTSRHRGADCTPRLSSVSARSGSSALEQGTTKVTTGLSAGSGSSGWKGERWRVR